MSTRPSAHLSEVRVRLPALPVTNFGKPWALANGTSPQARETRMSNPKLHENLEFARACTHDPYRCWRTLYPVCLGLCCKTRCFFGRRLTASFGCRLVVFSGQREFEAWRIDSY